MFVNWVWEYFLENCCMSIHKGYWFVAFISCAVILWFWHQENTGLQEQVWEVWIPFDFLKRNWNGLASLNPWWNSHQWGHMVLDNYLITNYSSFHVKGPLEFSIFSWIHIGSLCFSRDLFISSKLSNILTYNSHTTVDSIFLQPFL